MTAVDFTPSPALYPFRSRYFDSSAGRIHYVDEGSGPVLLMFHGNPTWSFLYRDVITALRGQFRCIAPDYPGFGLSDRPADYGYTPQEHVAVIRELVQHLNLNDMLVLVHDWGGPIGTAVAAAEHHRVRGMVLGNAWFWPPTRTFRLFSHLMSSPPGRWALLRHNVFVERILPHWTERALTDEEMHHYRSVQPTPAARRGMAELPRQILRARPWLADLEHDVHTHLATKPALITWPMRDRSFAPLLGRVRAMFPDHVFIELPTAGHYFTEDDPIGVAHAIAERFG